MFEIADPGPLSYHGEGSRSGGANSGLIGATTSTFLQTTILSVLFILWLGASLLGPSLSAQAGENVDQNQQIRPLRLVIFGDSLTAGYMLPQSAAFPAVLARELKGAGQNVEVVNASVSGDTASSGLARIEWALGGGADAVIVELGANDMLRGVDPARTKEALDGVIRRVRDSGAVTLLAGMQAAPGMGRAFEQQFNAIYPALAEAHGLLLYPFFLEGVAGRKELNLGDGIHPNIAGVEVLVRNILPYVLQLLETAQKR